MWLNRENTWNLGGEESLSQEYKDLVGKSTKGLFRAAANKVKSTLIITELGTVGHT